MKIEDLIKKDGYKNDTVKICEFLGFSDTEQLKHAKFFSIEQSYSPTLIPGISMSNNDYTWRLCEVVDDKEDELFSVDYGYKIWIRNYEKYGCGRHLYYQSDFLSMLKRGNIIYCDGDDNAHIEHIKWYEPLTENMFICHEADAIVRNEEK